MANDKVSDSCIGCYYVDSFQGQYYCCLSAPEIDADGFCNSYITLEQLGDSSYECSGQTFSP